MQAHIFILGFVQGVGLRRFIKGKANNLSLTGYVKNLSDGRVEVVVNGKKEDIEKLIETIEKGSFFADIKSVQTEWEKDENFGDFTILH